MVTQSVEVELESDLRIEQALLRALRENLLVLQELSSRYSVSLNPGERECCVAGNNPVAVAELLIPEMGTLAQEQLRVVLLNDCLRVLGIRVVAMGTLNAAFVCLADVFRPALLENAPHIILAHNHPSGSSDVSALDIGVTKQLLKAGKLLGVGVVDHIIVAGKGFVSMRQTHPKLKWAETGAP